MADTNSPRDYLLDTHVLLWWHIDADRLPPRIRELLLDQRQAVLISAASVWEIAIKAALPRYRQQMPAPSELQLDQFGWLAVSVEHAARAGALPRSHGDPFDRMLIAQAQVEGLTLITHDRQFAAYGIDILWA